MICPECGEKCSNCADGDICVDCGFCKDCVGEENFCSECMLCITCVEMVCSCGYGCTNCAVVCMTCCEVCSNCSDGDICIECGTCRDCSDSDGFCTNCGLCGNCVVTCSCGEGCEQCADICPECGEKCSECFDEFCASCDLCRECVESDGWCEECQQCGNCTDICEDCGEVCRDCAYQICEDCGKCSGCIDEFCPECGICIECAEGMCSDCYYCYNCVELICENCGVYCLDCAVICEECGNCENCVDTCDNCNLCVDCCADVSKDYGCDHGICVNSTEWVSHYCTVGKHCIDSSAEYDYDESNHWNICDSGCDVKLNVKPHVFGKGVVTKEATKKSEGIMTVSCVICGYEKTETIPKLSGNHMHEYTETVTKPTCTSNGYTTHSCSCGYTWVDNEILSTDHDYQYKYTANEHWLECTSCHETKDKASHKLGEWKTVVKAGYTFAGVKQRECRHCAYILAEEIPMLKIPENKVVITIENYPITILDGSGTSIIIPDDNETTESEDNTENKPATTTKELLTKGDDNTVPALPTLPPTERGNIFDGWVDKATGEYVKKGDKLTASIELIPVWKDCGEGKHTDSDNDNSCDDCGYIIYIANDVEETEEPEEVDKPDELDNDENVDDSSEGKPTLVIIIISLLGSALAAGVAFVLILLKKKKDKEKNQNS